MMLQNYELFPKNFNSSVELTMHVATFLRQDNWNINVNVIWLFQTFPHYPHPPPMLFLLSFCSWIINAQNNMEGQVLKMAASLPASVPAGLWDTVSPATVLH